MKKLSNNAIKIPRAKTPEEVGVSSKAIADFLDDIENTGINIHSFMIIRHGKVAAECYRAPYTAERPHAMYSVSKTVTGVAVGLAISEKLISLDDKVKDFFPDYTENIHDPRLDKLEIRHLLTMTSGKNPSVFADKSKGSWIEYYFNCPWYNEPGKEFRYINENMYMLCAIITRVTGMSVREYLTPRFFEPLGIDYPFWETDANGIEAGGWGSYLKTEDMAKIMMVYQQGGKFNGKQILPKEWTDFAQTKQADSSGEQDYDNQAGYCVTMWRNKSVNGFRCDGLFSQFGIVFDDYDAILAITSGIANNQECRNFLWKHFPAAFIDEKAEKEDTSYPGLKEKLENAVIEDPPRVSESSMEKKIEGRRIHFRKQLFLDLIGFPMSVLPLSVTYMIPDKAGDLNDLYFRFDDKNCTVTWTEGDETNTVPVGMDGKYRYGKMRLGQIDYKVCCTAQWLAEDRLFLQIRPYETIGNRTFDIKFRKNGKVVMKPSSTPDLYSVGMYLASTLDLIIPNEKIRNMIKSCIKYVPDIVEPKHRGRIKYNKE